MSALAALILAGVFFFSHTASSVTRPIFTPKGDKLILLLQAVSAGAPKDFSPRRLLDLMSSDLRPIPGGGEGKVVKSTDGALSMTCVLKTGSSDPDNVLCTIVITAVGTGEVRAAQNFARYASVGADAEDLRGLFVTDAVGTVQFVSDDGWLALHAEPGLFTLSFQN